MRPRLEIVNTHRSTGACPAKHPVIPVRGDRRDLTLESRVHIAPDGEVVLPERDGIPELRLELTCDAAEWIVEQLPEEDGFTEDLRYAVAVARSYE